MNNSSSSGSGSGSGSGFKPSQVSSTGTSSGTTSGMSSGSTSSGSGLSSGVSSNGSGSSSGMSPGMSPGMSSGSSSAMSSGKGIPSLQSFMTPTVKNLALGILVPAVLARIKLRWVAFGVVAYYGLRMLNQQGVLPKQAHQAFDSIDRGIDAAKEKIGFNKPSTSTSSIH